jgi:hypothetical protein
MAIYDALIKQIPTHTHTQKGKTVAAALSNSFQNVELSKPHLSGRRRRWRQRQQRSVPLSAQRSSFILSLFYSYSLYSKH